MVRYRLSSSSYQWASALSSRRTVVLAWKLICLSRPYRWESLTEWELNEGFEVSRLQRKSEFYNQINLGSHYLPHINYKKKLMCRSFRVNFVFSILKLQFSAKHAAQNCIQTCATRLVCVSNSEVAQCCKGLIPALAVKSAFRCKLILHAAQPSLLAAACQIKHITMS